MLDCDSNKTKIILQLFSPYSLIPIIIKPTRPDITNNNLNSTLIDHIRTTIPSVKRSGIIDVEITDHYPNFCFFFHGFHTKCENIRKQVKFSDFRIENKGKFCN